MHALQDKLTTDPPYSPLSPLDIERAGIPEMKGELDDYLKSRLDQLYAELRVSCCKTALCRQQRENVVELDRVLHLMPGAAVHEPKMTLPAVL